MKTFVKIKAGETETDLIPGNSDLRPLESMLPVIFNLVFERIIRETGIGFQEKLLLPSSLSIHTL